jgi:DNA-binding transcriptional ArsR family regulator
MSGSYFPMPDAADIQLVDIMRVLADPGRMKMLEILSDGRNHGCNLDEFPIGVQKSTLSHHFKTFREAGLTEVEIDGRNFYLRLRTADLESRFPGLISALTSEQAASSVGATA